MSVVVVAVAFAAIVAVELPDKTFLATLVLATKYPPRLVWLGVSLAFTVQTLIAVLLGRLATTLPTDAVHLAAAALFLLGAVILWRQSRRHGLSIGDEHYASRARQARGAGAVLASFLVLFAAEWGDLSQLLTVSLVARYDAVWSVFAGALAALLAVAGLAVIVGRTLLHRVSLRALHVAGAALCLVLGVYTVVEVLA